MLGSNRSRLSSGSGIRTRSTLQFGSREPGGRGVLRDPCSGACRSTAAHRKGNVMVAPDDLRLTCETAAAILGAKTEEVSEVRFLRPENHSWRVVVDGSAYYVKAHTKDWYRDTSASSFPVRHEMTGHRLLREAGLPVPSVAGYSTNTENPLGWPYLITRELEGASLVELLSALSP